ncbi:MAG TPA: efflux RND transporter periplasmic adaptor subunit [Ramlibacter sp.]|jgi:membrane fusion protein (multidrug efflux system)|uniref:efflux RND transporter periplasmic adaptor subunit n=1 Tax=Ramlibacter sp. TaxID=1917967 RepID=UPI002D60A5E8|nr:efflux RND transporter periplasmic adaptor subunit [Ramlibacter sp.]HZY18270.1 efflux RND transporter periplasmic adaptor subunit [Ramlibacter sp.]
MASKPLYTVIAVAGIAAASAAAWWFQNKPRQAPLDAAPAAATAPGPAGAASGPSRAPAVEVARVESMRLTDDAQAVGSLRSRQSVMVRPEVSGRITRINFNDGARVRRGQVLVQLDDQLPVAQMQQARAELSIARANHKRNQELVAQNFISQRSVEESAANLQVAEAKLALAEATAARLRIVAPFDGIAGIRGVNVGDYLKDGADIVNLEDLDAVYVDFRLPERFQTKLRPGQVAVVQTDALPGRRWEAVIQAIDPLVDANGRSIGIRGCIDNRQLALRPGMFARVTAVFGERDNALVVPEESIVPQGGRQFVFRVVDGPDQDSRTAQRVEVKVGLRRPGRVEITEGLQPGDLVITAGQQRLQRDGTPVRVMDVGRGGNGAGAAAANGGAPAAGGAGAAPAAAGPAPQAPARAIPVADRPAAEPARAGPNPCRPLVAEAGGAAPSRPAARRATAAAAAN